MIDLLLAIICSTSIALILKFSESRQMNRYAVTTMNYVVAFTISFILAPIGSTKFSINSFIAEYPEVLSGAGMKFTHSASSVWAVAAGICAGFLYFLGFIIIQKNLKINGVGITGAVSKTGIVVPVVLSMIFWDEIPNIIQTGGIILSIAAIVIINIKPSKVKIEKAVNIYIILLFFIVGSAEFSNKIFEKYALSDYKSLYLFCVFFTAFWVSLYFTIKKKMKGGVIKKRDIITGLAVGVPNMFTSFFLIRSFETYKASVAFPIYSSGSILLMTFGGMVIFRERLSRKDIISVLIIIIAIIMMNIK